MNSDLYAFNFLIIALSDVHLSSKFYPMCRFRHSTEVLRATVTRGARQTLLPSPTSILNTLIEFCLTLALISASPCELKYQQQMCGYGHMCIYVHICAYAYERIYVNVCVRMCVCMCAGALCVVLVFP